MEYYLALEKKETSVISDNTDELGGNYTKWNKPGTKTQILHDLIYMWDLKQLNSFIEVESETLVTRGWGQ